MLLSRKMITGFNTDVKHGGSVYHVQTEARGRDNPVLESLVYIGGTIIAKKMTPYADQLRQGATEEAIAVLLKRQHQVIIAAIRAGRVEELIQHSTDPKLKEKVSERLEEKAPPERQQPVPPPNPVAVVEEAAPKPASPSRATASPPAAPSKPLPEPVKPPEAQPAASTHPRSGVVSTPAALVSSTGGLNLDEVISDYVKRSSEQGRLDLKVLAPSAFIAGKSIGLRVQVSHENAGENGAIVTIKIIGTAFKPQVYLGRTGSDGVVAYNLVLPAFSAGTAAIVIEAQSSHGRGELKHLIRRA
jgi:hypothetical protein